MSPLEVVATVLMFIFILFFPGLVWSFVLFDYSKSELEWLERVLVGMGLGFALVPLTIFILNATLKIGVSLTSSILTALLITGVAALILLLMRLKVVPHDPWRMVARKLRRTEEE